MVLEGKCYYFGFVLQLTRFWNSRTWSSSWNSRNCVYWTCLSFKLKSSLAGFPLPLLNCSVRPQAAINTVRIESCRSSHIVSASSNQEIFQIQKFRTKSIYSSYISTSAYHWLKILEPKLLTVQQLFPAPLLPGWKDGLKIFMNTCGNCISSIAAFTETPKNGWRLVMRSFMNTSPVHDKFHEY